MNTGPSHPTTSALRSRRALAHVDPAAISANVAHLRAQLTAGAELCAVVKSDGYGHGIEQAARAALGGGATRLAVVTVGEVFALSRLELGVPILMLGPIDREELADAVACGAELTAWNAEQVEALAAEAERQGTEVLLHIKLDTGMGRFGAREEAEALAALMTAGAADSVTAAAVWTHFATADEPDNDYFDQQLDRFKRFVELARREQPDLLAHAANSAALLRDESSHFDFARAGIAIYGLDPFGGDAAARGLVPALSLTSYVASLRTVAAGESVGYGRRFVADRDTEIATIPIGYGDGWRRILTNNCEVLIGGQRHHQRGTISMDSMMVELAADSSVELGQEVTLIGRDGDNAISCETVAEQAATINYEITCGLTARTERVYGQRP